MAIKNRVLGVGLGEAPMQIGYIEDRLSVPSTQRGVGLLELMVGIALGLLVVAVAMGALMASRGLSGTVNDASTLQQQASYVFRTMGQQIRQAGGLYLNLAAPASTSAQNASTTPVFFETVAVANGGNAFDPKVNTISSTANSISVGYRRYDENVFTSTSKVFLSRNCLGGPVDSNRDNSLNSNFTLSGNDLRCGGNDTAASMQPIIQNVANFQVRYLKMIDVSGGNPKVQYVNLAAAQANWASVTGVEVCVVLYGLEPINGVGSYTDCDGSSVDMATLAAPRKNRLHMAFKNTFQLRSQGVS